MLAVVVAWLATGLSSLGQRDLWAPDEPKYALIAREMTTTGEYLIAHVNTHPYPDKPPLMFWLIALCGALLGEIGQPAAVLPSIAAAVATLLGTARLARRLAPSAPPWVPALAAGLTAVSFRFTMQGTSGQLDMLLTAFTTWALVLLLEGTGLVAGDPIAGDGPGVEADPTPSTRRLALAFALMGCGTLAKGPVAVILPIGGLLLGCWFSRRRPPWRALFVSLWNWGALLLVLGAWLLPAAVHALQSGNQAWLTNILFKQTAVRYAASWHHLKPVWYFLGVPWLDFFPSSLLLPAALLGLRSRSEASTLGARRLLAGCVLFAILFFSIPAGKRDLYLMPTYPWFGTWVALDLAWRVARGRAALLWPRFAGLLLALASGFAAFWTLRWLPPLAAVRGVTVETTLVALAFSAVAAVALLVLLAPHSGRYIKYLGVAWLTLYVAIFRTLYPAIDEQRSARRFVANFRPLLIDGAPGGMIDFRAQFGFYLGPLLEAGPNESAALEILAQRLAAPAPFFVLTQDNEKQELLKRLAVPPCAVYRQRVGDSDYVVLANRAALKPSSDPP